MQNYASLLPNGKLSTREDVDNFLTSMDSNNSCKGVQLGKSKVLSLRMLIHSREVSFLINFFYLMMNGTFLALILEHDLNALLFLDFGILRYICYEHCDHSCLFVSTDFMLLCM